MSKKNLSKFISLILRHKPEVIDIELDACGWASVEELIRGINSHGNTITLDILKEIVREDSKGRYSFNGDKTMIRANQGHSIKVDVGLKEVTPPDRLYHGTATRFIQSIREGGIRSGSRLYVHLSQDVDTAWEVGRRHGKPYIFGVDSARMCRDGYKFWLSENGVWLVEYVPNDYLIEKVGGFSV